MGNHKKTEDGELPAATLEDQQAADQEAADLVDLYFELEEPDERDALLDELLHVRSSVVDQFLEAMLQEDDDEYLRADAAAALARRGHATAVRVLEEQLAEPEDPHFFALAAQTLAAVRGPSFYDTLHSIWQDSERDRDQRREAMLGMEALDTTRALDDLVAFIDGIDTGAAMDEDRVEAAIMAFCRHAHVAAAEALAGLRDRLLACEDTAVEDREDLAELVGRGLNLLVGDDGEAGEADPE